MSDVIPNEERTKLIPSAGSDLLVCCGRCGQQCKVEHGDDPAWAVELRLNGCELCDEGGEDDYMYLNAKGEWGMLNPDGTRTFIPQNSIN